MEPAAQHAHFRSNVGDIIEHTDELLLRFALAPVAQTHETTSRNIEITLSTLRDSLLKLHTRFGNQDLVVAVLALTKSGMSTWPGHTLEIE